MLDLQPQGLAAGKVEANVDARIRSFEALGQALEGLGERGRGEDVEHLGAGGGSATGQEADEPAHHGATVAVSPVCDTSYPRSLAASFRNEGRAIWSTSRAMAGRSSRAVGTTRSNRSSDSGTNPRPSARATDSMATPTSATPNRTRRATSAWSMAQGPVARPSSPQQPLEEPLRPGPCVASGDRQIGLTQILAPCDLAWVPGRNHESGPPPSEMHQGGALVGEGAQGRSRVSGRGRRVSQVDARDVHQPLLEQLEGPPTVGCDPGGAALAEPSAQPLGEHPEQWRAAGHEHVGVDLFGRRQRFDPRDAVLVGRFEEDPVRGAGAVGKRVGHQPTVDAAEHGTVRVDRAHPPRVHHGAVRELEQVVDRAAENPRELQCELGGRHLTPPLDRTQRLSRDPDLLGQGGLRETRRRAASSHDRDDGGWGHGAPRAAVRVVMNVRPNVKPTRQSAAGAVRSYDGRMAIHLRDATADDAELIFDFITALAEYEREPDAVRVDAATLRRQLADPEPPFGCLIAELDGVPAGFALFFETYSTWRGRRGIHLEDLFVTPGLPGARSRTAAARAASPPATRQRDGARLEWAVLDWNEPAIGFYRTLGAISLDGWTTFRLTDQPLEALAAEDRSA